MKKTTKVILNSVLTAAMCATLITGSTLALFTGEDKVDIAVTSGKVDLRATASLTNVYSADENDNSLSKTVDGFVSGNTSARFFTGGTVTYAAPTLTLDAIAPGDGVELSIALSNYSTIKTKYFVILTPAEGTETELLENLEYSATYVAAAGGAAAADPTTTWVELTAAEDPEAGDDVGTVKVTVELPVEVGSSSQEQSCKLTLAVICIQSNGNYCASRGGHTFDADGKCIYCGSEREVVNFEPSTVEEFGGLLEKLQDPNYEVHAELKQNLIGNNISGEIVVEGMAELDFGTYQCRATSSSNGETLTAQNGGNLTVNAQYPGSTSSDYTAGMLKAIDGGQITINGEGKYKGGNPKASPYSAAINADGGIITINGGTFWCSSYQSTMVKSYNGGTVTVNGGKISCDNGGRMLVADGGTIVVNGGTLDLVDNAAVWFTASNGGEIVLGPGVTFSRRNAGTPQYFSVTGEGSRIVVYKGITNPGMITLEGFINQGKGSQYKVEELDDRWVLTAIA